MGKSSGGSKQANPYHARGPKAFGPNLSDPGPQLQLSAGGVPQPGAPDFANTSFGGQLGTLSPEMLEQIMKTQQAPQTPNAPAEPEKRGFLDTIFDLIRQRNEQQADILGRLGL